jgi:hypothetical protein
MTAIEAAARERRGEGTFRIVGREVRFRSKEGREFSWSMRTRAQAEELLALFRRAPELHNPRDATL